MVQRLLSDLAEELSASDNHWNAYHRRWAQLRPPLRPNDEIVSAFRDAIAGQEERVLLLGVTRELADLGRATIAVDRNEAMIKHIWPGDTARRRAQHGEWLSLPLPDRSVTAAIGDGSLSAVTYPDEQRTLLNELARVLRPRGIVALRIFATPEEGETLAQVQRSALDGRIKSFHAFKWHVAMAIATEQGNANVAVAAILDAVNALFPDREQLAAATGWSDQDIATIDVYRGSKEVYGFPTLTQLRAILPPSFEPLQVSPSGTYPLAERCPIVSARVRG